jgi:hypothetical protein
MTDETPRRLIGPVARLGAELRQSEEELDDAAERRPWLRRRLVPPSLGGIGAIASAIVALIVLLNNDGRAIRFGRLPFANLRRGDRRR